MAEVTLDSECKDPKELLGQGIRAFVLQDYEAAVVALSKTSELLVAEHGNDMHDSLADVYLYYGKALLGLSREQSEALGDAVPKNAEDSDDEDEGIDTEESEESKPEKNDTEKTVNGDNKQGSKKIDADNVKEKTENILEDHSKDEPKTDEKRTIESEPKQGNTKAGGDPSYSAGPSTSKADDEETTEGINPDEDEPTDLQVAWEVLELAKKIYQKQGEEANKNLAEALIVLGEVSLESENFESAVNDTKCGLEIQKNLFSEDSRTVAETYYKLGMAYSMNSQIDEAIDSFNSSLKFLQNRIKVLEEIKNMTSVHKEEVDEIKTLIPDIEEKIADMKTYKEEAIKKLSEAFKEPSKSTVDCASSSKQATNISHLVKRKRKTDEVEKEKDEGPAKKSAT